jgi:hypothetical protein
MVQVLSRNWKSAPLAVAHLTDSKLAAAVGTWSTSLRMILRSSPKVLFLNTITRYDCVELDIADGCRNILRTVAEHDWQRIDGLHILQCRETALLVM